MIAPYTLALANGEAAAVAATGSLTVGASWAAISPGDTVTIDDGTHDPHVLTVISDDGLSTTASNVDIFGALSADDIAAQLRAAIDAAQSATLLNIDAFLGAANVVQLSHNVAGAAGNVAITTTCAALEILPAGMAGGADLVPAHYTACDIRTITGNAQAYLLGATVRVDQDTRLSLAAAAPLTGAGAYATLLANAFANNAPHEIDFTGPQPVQVFYMQSSGATANLLLKWAVLSEAS